MIVAGGYLCYDYCMKILKKEKEFYELCKRRGWLDFR